MIVNIVDAINARLKRTLKVTLI